MAYKFDVRYYRRGGSFCAKLICVAADEGLTTKIFCVKGIDGDGVGGTIDYFNQIIINGVSWREVRREVEDKLECLCALVKQKRDKYSIEKSEGAPEDFELEM